MSNRTDGLEQKLRRLLDDLRNFKIANPDAKQQMQNMLERLNMLRDRNLGPAEQGLTRASKSLEQIADQAPASPASKDDSVKPALDQPQADEEQSPAQAAGQESKNQPPSRAAGKDSAGKADQKGTTSSERADKARSADQSDDAKLREQPSQVGPTPQPRPEDSPQDVARRSLAEAKINQKAIADELQKMLEGLGEFEIYRGVVKDAQALLKQQEATMKQAAEAATRPELMSKPAESLTPEQKAELGNLAARQADLARDLQNLLERMDDLGKRLDESDPLAAAAMRDAAGNSRKQGTSAKMGAAAEQLEKNQMGKARAQQDTARQELRELVDAVQNRRERELSRLVKELRKAESEMRETAPATGGEPQGHSRGKAESRCPTKAQPTQEAGQGTGADPAGVEAPVAATCQVECRSRGSGRLRRRGQNG